MKSKIKLTGDIIALDVGSARTGVARLHTIARIAEPLKPIEHDKQTLSEGIESYVADISPVAIVVGLPRGLDGQETDQTIKTRQTFDEIRQLVESRGMPAFLIDEAGTTKEAESFSREGESVDSIAAGLIAETWANEMSRGKDDTYEI